MHLQLDRATSEKGRALTDENEHLEQVLKPIKESVESGRVGALKLDPDYLVFEPQSCKFL